MKPCEWERRLFEFSQISCYNGRRVVNYPAKKHVLRKEATPEAHAGPVGEGDPANGELVFTQYCSSCHGPDDAGGALGPTLISAAVSANDDDFFRQTISNGRAGTAMPSRSGILSAQEIEDVISFLHSKQP